MEQKIYQSDKELNAVLVSSIADAAYEMYVSNRNKPVGILDIATGGCSFNVAIIKALNDKGIDYELILSDIFPTLFKIGYERLEKKYSSEELKKIKCVLADARDLRKELNEIKTIYHKDEVSIQEAAVNPRLQEFHIEMKTLEEVLKDPEFHFLESGYKDGKRIVDFSDGSFDLVIGCLPYGSINKGDYHNAIIESARVLRTGGYHIVCESQCEKVQSYMLRIRLTLVTMFGKPLKRAYEIAKESLSAIFTTRANHIEEVASILNAILSPVAFYSAITMNKSDEKVSYQSQKGDLMKSAVMVHKKVV